MNIRVVFRIGVWSVQVLLRARWDRIIYIRFVSAFVSASIYLSCWSRILSLGVMTRLLACLLLTFIAVISNKGLRWRWRLGGLSTTSHAAVALLFPRLCPSVVGAVNEGATGSGIGAVAGGHASCARAAATGGGIGAVAVTGTGAGSARVDPTCIMGIGSFPLSFSVATPGKPELIADASTTGSSTAGACAGGDGSSRGTGNIRTFTGRVFSAAEGVSVTGGRAADCSQHNKNGST